MERQMETVASKAWGLYTGLGYIILRSPYSPYSIYLRGIYFHVSETRAVYVESPSCNIPLTVDIGVPLVVWYMSIKTFVAHIDFGSCGFRVQGHFFRQAN